MIIDRVHSIPIEEYFSNAIRSFRTKQMAAVKFFTSTLTK